MLWPHGIAQSQSVTDESASARSAIAESSVEAAEVAAAPAWQDDVTEGERLFALIVAPALELKCAACHGQDTDSIESGLDLSSRESLLRGGDNEEPVLVPGKRDESWLYLSATWEHEQLQMPPKENDRLDKDTLEALGKWIDAGAPWPDEERLESIREAFSDGVPVATSGGLDSSWDQRRYAPETLWAYQPLDDVPVPTFSDLHLSNPIDAFLHERMTEMGVEPAGRADRHALVRRLYFDLTGLPPTPEQVADFVDDSAPDEIAWEQLIDRLLAAPQFGEQWARHWLDTVRYADSAGFANDYQRPNAWRYRDYVVRALNEDRPLSQFIREQIAGDEIAPHDPEKLIAVGMLRMGPWEQTGMSVDKVTRQQFLDDVTDVVGQAFLAHPLQCARCHDHKFDPIPTRDYYRIQAVFATAQFGDRHAKFLPTENRSVFDEQRGFLQERIKRYERMLAELNEKEVAAAKAWYAERGLEYGTRAEKQKKGATEDEIAPRRVGFQAEDFGRERIARKYLERHRWELDRYESVAFSAYSGPTPVRKGVQGRLPLPKNLEESGELERTSILTGGDPFAPSLPVTPGVMSVLIGVIAPERTRELSAISTETTGRRLEFADWLVDAKRNPLTPRVMVNRLWQHHFGRGIVKTPNNFGTAALQPTHPKLLDFLANELVQNGWQAKHIHRLILTSEAYCRDQSYAGESTELRTQLDERDPLGDSYATFASRRLSAEEIRDTMLQIAGLLNSEIGGAPIRPDLNPEVAVQPRQIMGTYAPIYQPSPKPSDRNRRTLYALRLRGLRDPMLEVFNQPSPDLPCELRDSSTVAPQALTTMNSVFAYERALAMAQRLLHKVGSDDASVIDRAFELAYGRSASPEESNACIEHWSQMTERHRSITLRDEIPPTEVTRTFVDENTGEPFTYTEPLEQNAHYRASASPATASPRSRGLAEVCLVLMSSNELFYVP